MISPPIKKVYVLTQCTNLDDDQRERTVTPIRDEIAVEQNTIELVQPHSILEDTLEHIQLPLVSNHKANTIIFNIFSLFFQYQQLHQPTTSFSLMTKEEFKRVVVWPGDSIRDSNVTTPNDNEQSERKKTIQGMLH